MPLYWSKESASAEIGNLLLIVQQFSSTLHANHFLCEF